MKIIASRVEKSRRLPGDELIDDPQGRVTYAITIDASPAEIFPWLKQMGCQRAGWYSYDRLDNGGKPSAEWIIPELQQVEVGDYFPATPNDPPGSGFRVTDIKENKYLLLSTFSRLPSMQPVEAGEQPEKYWRTTWLFFLEPLEKRRTRLIVRNNLGYKPRWVGIPANLMILPIHFIMQRRQLLNIKERAEGR